MPSLASDPATSCRMLNAEWVKENLSFVVSFKAQGKDTYLKTNALTAKLLALYKIYRKN